MSEAIKNKIDALEAKYKGDSEALDEINRAKQTIEYYESKNEPEKAQAHANNLEAYLNDWY